MESKSDPCECEETGICRASDLPIYTQCDETDIRQLTKEEDQLPGYLKSAVITSKNAYDKISESFEELKTTGQSTYQATKENVTSMYFKVLSHRKK